MVRLLTIRYRGVPGVLTIRKEQYTNMVRTRESSIKLQSIVFFYS